MTNRKNLYGYHTPNGELTVLPEESAVVKQIAALYIAGGSYQGIADSLNQNRIPFSAEAPLWNKHKVKRLLENPRYTGANGYPLILDKTTFQAVQARIRTKTENYTFKEKRPALMLKDRLRCDCGGTFQRLGGTARRKDTLYLKCQACGIQFTILDEHLLAQVSAQLAEYDRPVQNPYAPSSEVIRLNNAINRGLERPDAPEDVVSLILQGVSARYNCCPAPIEQENNDCPTEVDLKRFGQAVSHITITGNQDVTVHFK